MPNDFNQPIIEEFRANQGRVGGWFEGARLLLLTTTGARTGARHTVPLGYLQGDEPMRRLVIGSAGGADKQPDWYRNILANPRVTVEDGTFTFTADAVVLEGEERDRLFARAVEADPGWAEYQAKTSRILPVVALDPVDGGPNAQRWGDGLKEIHNAFRKELDIVRAEVAASGPGLGAQLRINCMAVCSGLHYHHQAEDGQMFPALDTHPELAEVLTRLRAEHQAISQLLDALQELLAADHPDPAALLPEFDRLTGEVKAHLDYEEEQLLETLNAMTPEAS